MRVPFIALSTKPVYAFARCDPFRDHGLDQFKESADSENDCDGQRVSPAAPRAAEAKEKFAERKGQKEAESEMRYAIKVIPAKTKMLLRPKSERHFRIGVMRSYDVQKKEGTQTKVSGGRKLDSLPNEKKNRRKSDHENVLQQPCLTIERLDGSDDPGQDANRSRHSD